MIEGHTRHANLANLFVLPLRGHYLERLRAPYQNRTMDVVVWLRSLGLGMNCSHDRFRARKNKSDETAPTEATYILRVS